MHGHISSRNNVHLAYHGLFHVRPRSSLNLPAAEPPLHYYVMACPLPISIATISYPILFCRSSFRQPLYNPLCLHLLMPDLSSLHSRKKGPSSRIAVPSKEPLWWCTRYPWQPFIPWRCPFCHVAATVLNLSWCGPSHEPWRLASPLISSG